jgi:hypothetical protein
MRRIAALVTMLLLLGAAPAAVAQSGPFAPLPQAPPAETPTPAPVGPDSSGDVSRQTLFIIGGGVLVAFFAIGWAISRDARRNLTDEDRRALERAERHEADPEERRRRQDRVKQRARQRTKAQKAARRHNRPR